MSRRAVEPRHRRWKEGRRSSGSSPRRSFLGAVLALAVALGGCGDGTVVEPGPVSLRLAVAASVAAAQGQVEGVAEALAAADEVFVFVGAFEGGLDTLSLLDELEERAIEDAAGLVAELSRVATVVHADWVPLGGGPTVRLDVLGPEGDTPVVVIALVAAGRRVLFVGASPPVVLRVAPPPRVEIPLTPLAWDVEATVDALALPGVGSVGDLDAVGRFATGHAMGSLPSGTVAWRSLGPQVVVLDAAEGTVRGAARGLAAVEVENLLPGFSLDDDGSTATGKVRDTVLVRVGGQ